MVDKDDDSLTETDIVSGIRAKAGKGADKGSDPLLFDVNDTSDKGGFDLDDVLRAADDIVIEDEKPTPKPKRKTLVAQPKQTAPVERRVIVAAPAKKRPPVVAQPKGAGPAPKPAPKSAPKPAPKPVATETPYPLPARTVPIPLDLADGLRDMDNGQGLTVQIAGLMKGANLTAGAKGIDGIWRLTFDQLTGLKVYPSPGRDLPFDLTVSVMDGREVILTGEIEVVPILEDEDGAPVISGAMPAPWDWTAELDEGEGGFDPKNKGVVELVAGGTPLYDKAQKPVKWK